MMGGNEDFSDSPEAKLPFPFGFDWDQNWELGLGLVNKMGLIEGHKN